MSRTAVKICGLRDDTALTAALSGGAGRIGMVFYPPSPRHLSVAEAAALAARVPDRVGRVGVFANPDDTLLGEVLDRVPLSTLQLSGRETPRRVAELRTRYGLPIIKTLSVSAEEDLARANDYHPLVDFLLFDAKPPKGHDAALPGGNGLAFDWQLIAGRIWPKPWLLAGGLTPDNVAEAVEISGAPEVDVSSGVESAPGVKDPELITRFCAALA